MDRSFDSSLGSRSYDRTSALRASTLRMASPRIGGSYAADDELRTRSPYYGRSTGSFRISESSPSERRRLVSELRSEVRKASTRPLSSPSRSSVPFPSSGYDNGVKRSFESSLREERRAPLDFDERYPSSLGRSIEEDAERELAELERSTENLRKLGTDILSSANAFVTSSLLDPNFVQRNTQLPRSGSNSANTSFSSQQHFQPQGNITQPVMHQQPFPTSYMAFSQGPMPAAYGMQHMGQQPQPVYQGQPQAYPMAMMPNGTLAQVVYQQPSAGNMPPATYIIMPGPAPYPMVVPQAAATAGPVVPTDLQGKRPEQQSQNPAQGQPPAAQEQQNAIATKNERVSQSSGSSVTFEPRESLKPATEAPTVPVGVVASDSKPRSTDAVDVSRQYEPSGQSSAEIIPPAHVDVNALEEERKRRLKKEFLAKRQKDPSASAIASLAEAAVDIVKSKEEEVLKTSEVSKIPATTDSRSAPAATPRPVIIAQASEPSDLPSDSKSDLVNELPKADSNITGTEEEIARAERLKRLAEQAERLPVVDNSMAVVPFGVFLKNSTTSGGSYDDADLAGSFRRMRPPPVFSKGSSDALVTGRRRARSHDGAESGGSTIKSPPSDIAAKGERRPIEMQGYLLKTSGPKRPTQLHGTWQRRWFILSGKLLLYTASAGSSQVKRMIDLSKVEVVTDRLTELQTAPTGHCIGIIEKGEPRILTICAETHQEILAWYKGILQNCALLSESKITQRSLPPQNRTKMDDYTRARKELEAKHIAALPAPPRPEMDWFYPLWEKPKSYYDMLGVPPDATAGMIKKSYYKIAKDSHPDRSTRSLKGDALIKPNVAPEEFAGIALAYETLIDPQKRSEYDLAEKVKEQLRHGIDCYRLECIWNDDDLRYEPRLRTIRKVVRRRITIFCDGEIRCLYWQDASAPDSEGNPGPLLPLRPNAKQCVEMRFVQQVVYFRDGPIDFGKNEPPPYEGETRFLVLGDRLHTGPLLFQMDDSQACTELVHGLRVARCEKSMLFQQKLDALKKQGIQ